MVWFSNRESMATVLRTHAFSVVYGITVISNIRHFSVLVIISLFRVCLYPNPLKIMGHWHIETEPKGQCRQLQENVLFGFKLQWNLFWGPKWYKVSIGSDNGLALKRLQIYTGNSDDPFQWLICITTCNQMFHAKTTVKAVYHCNILFGIVKHQQSSLFIGSLYSWCQAIWGPLIDSRQIEFQFRCKLSEIWAHRMY